ncbi:multidrug efflux SMR transporter [Streptomyces sp. RB6PN25]|uniref:Multidrug efflux SMR transporter n=1 Tax=Streptomyces humicola TaxID=2953240 RepID=A0ABT1PRR7_9ACTN|nr:multidrug efflux SMR transporter [Streptomyces humicola]MCQ4080367.1 multidrug efflux SMR transporter [Streptomyces humicola]
MPPIPPYLVLALAISSEICSTVALKYTHGFTRLLPTAITVTGYVVSFILLGRALRTIPVSIAYAIWSGAGTAVVAAVGFTFLGEPVGRLQVIGILLIIAGVVALNLGGATH